jgi:sugar porter (SP) family MFS transporter
VFGRTNDAPVAGKMPSNRAAIQFASVAALGGLMIGYDVSVTNGAVAALEDQFQIGSVLLGFASGAALLGGAAGALIDGRIADRLGRLSMMKLAAALFFVGAIGIGLAPNIWLVVAFHVLGGVGIGVASATAPAYIAEISPPRIRGRLGSLQQLAIVSGIFLALAVDWLPFHIAGGSREQLWLGLAAWRWTFLAETIPALLYAGLVFTIPESPRYLVAAQRIPEARRVLWMLLGERGVERTLNRIADTLRDEPASSWRDLRGPAGGLHSIVWVGLGLAVFQQTVGITVIFYYGSAIWQAVGFGEGSSFAIAVITSVVNVLVTLVAIALIDKIGRRVLLLAGSAGMAATLATMSIIFAGAPMIGGKPHLVGASGPIALIATNLFVIAFGVSWGPVVWVLLGEIFPNRIRTPAIGLAVAVQWTTNFAVAFTFPGLRHALGVAYGFYTVCAVLSFVFVWQCVRETRGLSLEDMHADVS